MPRMRNLVAPPGESRRIIRYVADSKPVSVFGHYANTWRYWHNRKHITYCIFVRKRSIRQVTRSEDFVKFGRVIFEIYERTGRQTHRQTYRSQHFAPLIGAK